MITLLGCTFQAAFAPAARAQEPPLLPSSYVESTRDIPNPERGFYHWRTLSDLWGLDQIRASGHTLLYLEILANRYRDRPFDPAFLGEIQSAFDRARALGLKVIPRVAYNNGPKDGGGKDASLILVLVHIQQMSGLWTRNKDVIAYLDAGFIGQWGEWHHSTNGLESTANKSVILRAILQNTPKDRDVNVRSPGDIRAIFQTDRPIPLSEAFSGSDFSRVGHHNDCFLADPTDMGTYTYDGYSRAREVAYLGARALYVPWSGETCHYDPVTGSCPKALSEMALLHCSALNADYNPEVLEHWKADGCFEEVQKRLGYRFTLVGSLLPAAVKPGGFLKVSIRLKNTGFGQLYNPRPVRLVLHNNATNAENIADFHIDPRWWQSGKTVVLQGTFQLPANLPRGSYALELRMPDASPSLSGDTRYSIRFANQGTWIAPRGSNLLRDPLLITSKAPGATDPSTGAFREITPK